MKLLRIEGHNLIVEGIDLLDNTPVLDIKPYVVYCDSFPNARSGYVDEVEQSGDHENMFMVPGEQKRNNRFTATDRKTSFDRYNRHMDNPIHLESDRKNIREDHTNLNLSQREDFVDSVPLRKGPNEGEPDCY